MVVVGTVAGAVAGAVLLVVILAAVCGIPCYRSRRKKNGNRTNGSRNG